MSVKMRLGIEVETKVDIEMNIEENKMENNQTEGDAEDEPNKCYSANRTSLVCT
jgi:hypothetical protein